MTSSSTPKSRAPMIIGGVLLLVVVAVGIYMFAGNRQREFTPLEQEAIKFMKSDLAGLRMAEATINRTRGRYMTDPEEAGAIPSVGIDRPVIHVTDQGWSATLTAPAVPNVKCAIAIDERNPLSRSAKSGEIVCR